MAQHLLVHGLVAMNKNIAEADHSSQALREILGQDGFTAKYPE